MKEESKIVIYKQLMKLEIIAKMKDEKLVDWDKFTDLSDKEILKYSLEYRDKCLESFKKDKRAKEENKNEFYLEFPDINLEGEDLSDIYLHTFMAGFSKERNNGKKVFVTANINLKNTKCNINLATLKPIIVSEDGINIKEIIADVKKCDFRGCKVFGKFQNSKAKLEYGNKNLPKEYIERLEKYKVPEDVILTTNNVYLDMIERKIVKGTNGLEKVKQIVDYDLTGLKNDIWKYRNVIKENKMDISFTGAFIYEYGLDSIGKENYYINLEGRAKEAYKAGDLKYVEEVFKELDKDTRKNLVTLALRDGLMEFVAKHNKELTTLQKKYLNLQDREAKAVEEENAIKEILRNQYKENKLIDFNIELMNASIGIRSDIIEEIYQKKDLKLVEKYLDKIDTKVKNDILVKEYKKGNKKFVLKNFEKLDNTDIRREIINEEWENKNLDFLCKNYQNIKNQEMKSQILELTFKEGKVEFLREHFDELPKNMQIEAVIKFKDLGLPENVILDLLRR